MFWKRPEPNSSHDHAGDLRDLLTDRLRLALDFATLGAYELTGPDDEARAADDGSTQQGAAKPERTGARAEAGDRHDCARPQGRPRQRLARPHVRTAEQSCTSESTRVPERDCARARAGKSRRGGSVQVADQPCTWAAVG